MKSELLLEVNALHIGFAANEADQGVVRGLHYTLHRGQCLGIVGESGSGKSISSLALMGLLPKNAWTEGNALFYPRESAAVDLLHCHEKTHRGLRGKRISMVFQEPMTSLNPLHTCGRQVGEVLVLHENLNRAQGRERCLSLFEEVKLPRPSAMFDAYPHQLSGGQKQRVMIAMALACKPDLLIADEPTTALDVTVQQRILDLLKELQEKNDMGMVFITHDLGVVAQVAHDVLVMYRGEVVEQGPARQLLDNAQQPYTRALVNCRPRLGHKPERLPTVNDFLASEAKATVVKSVDQIKNDNPFQEVLLSAEDLNIWYPTAQNMWGKPTAWLKAVNGVNLKIYRGETLGLVGESGCGKSTLGRSLLRLQPIQSGRLHFQSTDVTHYTAKEMKPLRRKMQLIFQDPYGALNPRLNVEQALLEPMTVHNLSKAGESNKKRLTSLLDRVGLPQNSLNKYPHEFSGGQRQRICIARALVVEPDFIVCDESVSALDVSVQAQVLNLLNDLKAEFGLTYLFISHDLSVVQYMSDHIGVMKNGQLIEYAEANTLYENPREGYTKSLIHAIPQL